MLCFKFVYSIVIPIFRLLYRVRVIGKENIPEDAAVICANHTSFTDPIFLCAAYGIKTRWAFLAKAELFKIPVLNWILDAICAIPVNRGATDISTLRNAIAALKDGKKVMIFPEGTRVRDGEDSSGAKTGAAMIATRAGVPMIPVYISRKRHLFGKVDIVIGKAISTNSEEKGQTKYRALADEVFKEIMRLGNGGEESGEN